jgi:hypothetical protein
MPRAPTIVFGVLVALAASAPARATITLTPGNNPQPDEANVLFNHGDFSLGTGTPLSFPPPPPFSVVGTTNTTPSVSVLLSSSENLYVQGGGQGLVIATSVPGNPATQVGFTDFTIGLPTTTALDVIFDAHLTQGQGQPGTGGTATITVLESNGSTTTFNNVALGNGQNFQTLVASGGQDIKSVEFVMNGTGTFTQLEQIRVSGLSGVDVVPEPSTMAMAGMGLVTLAVYGLRNRRKTAT